VKVTLCICIYVEFLCHGIYGFYKGVVAFNVRILE